MAAPGIIQDAIHYPIKSVACCVDRVAEERILSRKDGTGGVVERSTLVFLISIVN